MERTHPKRENYYINQDWFPKELGCKILQINDQLEAQFSDYLSLSKDFLARKYPNGYEPTQYTSEESVEITYPKVVIGILPEAWDQTPVTLKEIFGHYNFSFDNILSSAIQLSSEVRGFGTFFYEEGRGCPNIDWESSAFPLFSTTNLSFSQKDSKKELFFRFSYEMYAHKSTANYAPPHIGYVHEINLGNRDTLINENLKVLLNSPQYTSVRWGLFEDVKNWMKYLFERGLYEFN